MIRPFGYGTEPSGWHRTQLRSFLTRSRRHGRTDLPLLSVNLPQGVVPRFEGDGRPAPSEDLSTYQVVGKGDLVMNQLGKPHGALGVSRHVGIISPAYFVANIGSEVEPRFVHHLLRTRLYISEYERRGKFMPPSQFDISWEDFRSIPVVMPPIATQRAIADYLDQATARIDNLIAAKRRIIELLDERQYSIIERAWRRSAQGVLPLRRFVSRVVQGWSPDSEGRPADVDEWGVVKAGCVKRMLFDANENKALSADIEIRTDLEIHEGDLLVNRASGSTDLVGNAAIVDHTKPKLMLCDKVFRLDAQADVNPRFLMYAISSPTGRAFIEPRLTGNPGTAYNLAQDVLLSIPVPTMSAEDMERTVLLLDEAQRLKLRSAEALQRQIGLLLEHRSALITATVAGAQQIPGAAT